MLKRRPHLNCIVRYKLTCGPISGTSNSTDNFDCWIELGSVSCGEGGRGRERVRVRTSYSSNIKVMKYYAAQMLLFVNDMTPKLGLKHPEFVYFKSFVMSRPRIYRDRVYMLNG